MIAKDMLDWTEAVTGFAPFCTVGGVNMLEIFRKSEPLLSVLIWPLMLQVTMRTFAQFEIPYVLCLVGELTLFGFFRIIAVGLGLKRPSIPPRDETR